MVTFSSTYSTPLTINNRTVICALALIMFIPDNKIFTVEWVECDQSQIVVPLRRHLIM